MGSCVSHALVVDANDNVRNKQLNLYQARKRKRKRKIHNNRTFCLNCITNNVKGVVKGFKYDIDINKLCISGIHPIHYAIKNNYVDLAHVLVNRENKGYTVLHACVIYKNIELLSILLEKMSS